MTKVKQVKLSDIVDISYGSPVKANTIKKQGVFPVVKISNFSSGAIKLSDMFIDSLPLDHKNTFIEGGEILVAMSGSTGKAAFNSHNIRAIVNQRIAILRADQTKVDINYLKHLIVNYNFENYCQKMGTGMQKNITNKKLGDYKIFLPDLDTQTRISSLLDKFTLLEAELEAELEKELLNYGKLFDFVLNSTLERFNEPQSKKELFTLNESEKKVADEKLNNKTKIMKLGDVVEIVRGERVVKSQLDDNYKHPVISGGVLPMGFYHKTNRTKGTVSISQYGTAGCVLWHNEDYWANDVCYTLKHKHIELNEKYLYYTLISLQSEIGNLVIPSYPQHLPLKRLINVRLPIPSILEQNIVVAILDKFVELEKVIKKEIKKEIELNKKRYEYYRNKLLTFDKN